ncbi:MAG: YggS family pyridoxal phosphate-dependent enzyme [Thermovirgaceae bacterium]
MVAPLSVAERIATIKSGIDETLFRSGQTKRHVRIVAVTKTRTVEEMVEAARSGVDAIGENRVQEALDKYAKWPEDVRVRWHMVGHLQRNKARKALEIFSCIQSLSRRRLADTLERLVEETNKDLPVLIEVNISGEESKHGVDPALAEGLAEYVLGSCSRLKLEGLMGIAPFTQDERAVRNSFARLRILRDKLRARLGVPLPTLSMGMSGDYLSAVAEGSNMVRIGSAIFGGRRAG